MNSNANPSLNPNDNDSLTGAFRHIVNKILQDVNGALPARVVAYEPYSTGDRVQVQPLITVLDTLGNQIQRAQIASIPVLRLGGGGYIISFPLTPGDLGWIIANDRDISLFLQDYQMAPPNTVRKNNFSDSFFVPAAMTGYTISSGDLGNLILQNLEGTVKISLGINEINITAQTVNIDGNLMVNGQLGFNQSLTPNISSNIFINGNIEATGTITPDVPP